jgi:hypothetical protein
MADAELHQKMLAFLMTEWGRKENRQLVGVDLLYSPGGGYKNDPLRQWERADEPEMFAEYVNIEKLVSQIIEIAETDVDTRPGGKHRYLVRTRQHMGTSPTFPFALQPNFHGSTDETAIAHGGGAGGGGGGGGAKDVAMMQIMAQNNGQLMRTNQQMFDGTIRVLGHQNQNMHEQIIALRDENAKLRMDLEEARSNKMDREFQMAMAAEKNNRNNAAFQKLFQFGTVIVSKIAADGAGPAQLGEGSPLIMLINDLKSSLRPEQMQALMGILDMPQKITFMEIIKMSTPPDQGPPPGQGPGQPPRPPGGPTGPRP